jgi:hypothetical protein
LHSLLVELIFYSRLHENPQDGDIYFFEEVDTTGMYPFRYHKAIMGASSPQMAMLCNQTPVRLTKNLSVISIPKLLSSAGFQALTKWLYYGEVRVEKENKVLEFDTL